MKFKLTAGRTGRQALIVTAFFAWQLLCVLPAFSQGAHHLGAASASTGSGSSSGEPDKAFAAGDKGYDSGEGPNGLVYTSMALPLGKMLVGGKFGYYNRVTAGNIAAVNTDGSPDTTFKSGFGADSTVYVFCRLNDGKILVGGEFAFFDNTFRPGICRLHPNGSLDTTFKTGGDINGSVRQIALSPNGKIYIAGDFTQVGGQKRAHLACLNGNGSTDKFFNPQQGFDGRINSMTCDSYGRLIIGGNFNNFQGLKCKNLARLDPLGTLDERFTVTLDLNGPINTVISVPESGKIIIAGNFTRLSPTIEMLNIAQLDDKGQPDPIWAPRTGTDSEIKWATTDKTGRITVCGSFEHCNGSSRKYVARLGANGLLDASFNCGEGPNLLVWHVSTDTRGNTYPSGLFRTFSGVQRKYIVRLGPSGSLDAAFNPVTGFDNEVAKLKPYKNGKFLAAGEFTGYYGHRANYMVRLEADGRQDKTFDTKTLFDKGIHDFHVMPDGKVLVAGHFTKTETNPYPYLCRLNVDGSLDAGFNAGKGPNDAVTAMAVAYDGKIIISGDFTQVDGHSRKHIARLNADGSQDRSFIAGKGFDGAATSIIPLPDGKILLGGDFTEFNGVSVSFLIRLNADGSLDKTFSTGSGPDGSVATLHLLPDGKILAAGQFRFYDGKAASYMMRLNANGKQDTAFSRRLGTYFYEDVKTFIVHNEDIFAVGRVTDGERVSAPTLLKLFANGKPDESLKSWYGFNNTVNAIIYTGDNRMLAAGMFTAYKNTGKNRLLKIMAGE
ncbi:MAG: hypothetical protein V4543_12580 [Bacteroidota bacterium]